MQGHAEKKAILHKPPEEKKEPQAPPGMPPGTPPPPTGEDFGGDE